jgi:hypothetical protein
MRVITAQIQYATQYGSGMRGAVNQASVGGLRKG